MVAVFMFNADAAALTMPSVSTGASVANDPEPSLQTENAGGSSTTRRRCANAGNATTTRQTNHARFIKSDR